MKLTYRPIGDVQMLVLINFLLLKILRLHEHQWRWFVRSPLFESENYATYFFVVR